jgi:RNA polymerase sigma factor (sigma-70 family)
MDTNSTEVSELVAHLFRHKASQIIAILTRIFGFANLDLAEDVVQETLVKALQQWPFTGVPDNPSGWIIQVAKNQALDILRRQNLFRDKQADITRQLEDQMSPSDPGIFSDEQLTMMFACCDPAFPREIQTALILKSLCAFSVSEIARAFLTQESAIAQRLVRAKRRIREQNLIFELPDPKELPKRLDAVLQVLYLLFNEGYSATEGENLIRQDLCEESIRLASLLADHPMGDTPKTHALLSLMYFQSSRSDARIDPEGNLLLISEQDRSQWNRAKISQGFYHLDKASTGKQVSTYHLEAGIASVHSLAPSYEETDWPQILSLYDALIALNPTPIAKLNRAVALSMIAGPQTAIRELEPMLSDPVISNYYLFPATLADLYRRMGLNDEAAAYYEKTLQLARTQPERNFIIRKLNSLSSG